MPCVFTNMTIEPIGQQILPSGQLVPDSFILRADVWQADANCMRWSATCSCSNELAGSDLGLAIGPPIPFEHGFHNDLCSDPVALCDPDQGVSATLSCLEPVTAQLCSAATVSGTVVYDPECETFAFRPANNIGGYTWADNSRLQRDQGGSIELGGMPNHGTPYIDFHFGDQNPPAGTLPTPAQDFNVRVINEADSTLTVRASQGQQVRLNVEGDVAVSSATGFVRWGAGSVLNPDQGGSIELVGTVSAAVPPTHGTPYIDFRRAGATDYDVRLANETSRTLTVRTETAGQKATLDVKGDVTCSGQKCFVQPHPTDPAMEIVYAALEGGEAGTYVRGSAMLVDGETAVDLPEHFGLVTGADALSVHLTPRGEWLQLYAVEVTPSRLIVRDAEGRSGAFDYLVHGVRRGYEYHQMIRARTHSSAMVHAAPE